MLTTAEHTSSQERDLVAAVRRKDRKATARFVEEYADCVFSYVRHRLAPRADLVDDSDLLAALSVRGLSPLA